MYDLQFEPAGLWTSGFLSLLRGVADTLAMCSDLNNDDYRAAQALHSCVATSIVHLETGGDALAVARLVRDELEASTEKSEVMHDAVLRVQYRSGDDGIIVNVTPDCWQIEFSLSLKSLHGVLLDLLESGKQGQVDLTEYLEWSRSSLVEDSTFLLQRPPLTLPTRSGLLTINLVFSRPVDVKMLQLTVMGAATTSIVLYHLKGALTVSSDLFVSGASFLVDQPRVVRIHIIINSIRGRAAEIQELFLMGHRATPELDKLPVELTSASGGILPEALDALSCLPTALSLIAMPLEASQSMRQLLRPLLQSQDLQAARAVPDFLARAADLVPPLEPWFATEIPRVLEDSRREQARLALDPKAFTAALHAQARALITLLDKKSEMEFARGAQCGLRLPLRDNVEYFLGDYTTGKRTVPTRPREHVPFAELQTEEADGEYLVKGFYVTNRSDLPGDTSLPTGPPELKNDRFFFFEVAVPTTSAYLPRGPVLVTFEPATEECLVGALSQCEDARLARKGGAFLMAPVLSVHGFNVSASQALFQGVELMMSSKA